MRLAAAACGRRARAAVLIAAAVLPPRPASAQTDVQACLEAFDQGQRARAAGKLLVARDRFLACGQESCPSLVKRDCISWQADVAAALPTIVFGARDARGRDVFDVRISVDETVLASSLDGKAVAVDPGQHTLSFERAGSLPVTMRVLVKEGEKMRAVDVTMNDATPSAPAPATPPAPETRGATGGGGPGVAPWVLVGLGTAIVATGVVIVIAAPSTPPGCSRDSQTCTRAGDESDAAFRARQEEAGEAESLPVLGAVVAGTGLVVAGAGLAWYLIASSKARSSGQTSLRVTPWASVDGAGLGAVKSF